MRVGIYNRWLFTLGGGEKYGLTIAECLSRNHSVDVITHKPVSKEVAEQRLNLDLSRVEFVHIPERPSIEIAPLTSKYDLFICASFLDLFPTLAAKSAMVIFFPTPLSVEPKLRIRRQFGLAIKKLLMVPSFEDGVLSTDAVNGTQRRHATGRVAVSLPASRRDYAVHFDIASHDASVRRALVSIDKHLQQTIDLASDGDPSHCHLVVPASQGDHRTLTIYSESDADPFEGAPVKMLLSHFEVEHPSYRVYRIVFERWFKKWGLMLYRIPSTVTPFLDRIKTYDALWAISEFSASWTKHYWNLPSQILYPPIDVEEIRPAPKQNRILTVGRFFVGSHSKKHRDMVAAFKRMVDAGLTQWELHLAGGVAPSEDDRRYLTTITDESKGYPIYIHADASRDDLLKLYASSAIYWHAAGFGESEESEPIRFEHFGIATVEAMAAGCVPVVINRGGQKEIVRNGVNGFLWNSLEELQARTSQLIQDLELRQRLSESASRDSRQYDKAHFEARLNGLLDQLGIEA